MWNRTKAWCYTDSECSHSSAEKLTELTQDCVHPVDMTITDTKMYEENLLISFKNKVPKKCKKRLPSPSKR